MAKYKLVNNIVLEGTVEEAGTIVDIQDAELAKNLLERGSITELGSDDKGAGESSDPLSQASVSVEVAPVEPTPTVSPELENQGVQPTTSQVQEDLGISENSSTEISSDTEIS